MSARTRAQSLSLRIAIGCILLVSGARRVVAQELRGTVRDSASGLPVVGAVLTLVDSADRPLERRLADARGQYRLSIPAAARRIRILRLGFRPKVLTVPRVPTGVSTLDVVMVSVPMLLQGMQVSANRKCPTRTDGPAAFALLAQARDGLLATMVARDSAGAGTMKVLRFSRTMVGNSDEIRDQSVQVESAVSTTAAFGAAYGGEDFVRDGFMRDSDGVQIAFGPDARVMLDDAFGVGYCFRLADRESARPNQVGLAFMPAERKRGRVDIDGTLWIDTVARALVDIEFRYVGLDPTRTRYRPGGRVSFRSMPNGVVLVDRWSLRIVAVDLGMATVLPKVDGSGRAGEEDPLLKARLHVREIGGELARVQWPDGTSWRASLGVVRMHLFDLHGDPAARAAVRLANTDYRAAADSAGDLEITDLLPGPYSITLLDAKLSSLGIEPESRSAFFAVRDSVVTLKLQMKTAADYAIGVCAAENRGTTGNSLIVGRILTPDGKPADGATWTIEKTGTAGMVFQTTQTRSGSDGVFAYCGLDRWSRIIVRARLGNATAVVERELTGTVEIIAVWLSTPDA